MSKTNPYAPKSKSAPVKVEANMQESSEESVRDLNLGQEDTVVADSYDHHTDVPTGNVDDVMTWVGSDKDRAQLALDAEEASDKPRKSLISKLNEIV